MTKIKVAPEKILNIGKKMKLNSMEINGELDLICEKYEKINGYWESGAWDGYYQLYKEQKKIIYEVQKEISKYEPLVQECSQQYKNVEKENKDLVTEVLPGNIIK